MTVVVVVILAEVVVVVSGAKVWAGCCSCGIYGGKKASSASRKCHLIGRHVDRYEVEVVDKQEQDALGQQGLFWHWDSEPCQAQVYTPMWTLSIAAVGSDLECGCRVSGA